MPQRAVPPNEGNEAGDGASAPRAGDTLNRRPLRPGVVRRAPAPRARAVLKIIFGDNTQISAGDEFTVDFAKLSNAICRRLCETTRRRSCRG